MASGRSVIVGVVTTIDLPDELGHVELSPTNNGYTASITRRGVDETVAWRVFPPEGEQDAWTSVTATGAIIRATSWSCWQVALDAESGQELERLFTK